MRTKVEVFTDGACRGNPGPGGWAALLRTSKAERMLDGAEPNTTNNRMELMAAIEGLAALKRPCAVTLTTDSEYVRQGITSWLAGWKRRGWRTSGRQPVKNQDLWQRLDEQNRRHAVDWRWVRGHSGHPENERVDAAARDAIERMQLGDGAVERRGLLAGVASECEHEGQQFAPANCQRARQGARGAGERE